MTEECRKHASAEKIASKIWTIVDIPRTVIREISESAGVSYNIKDRSDAYERSILMESLAPPINEDDVYCCIGCIGDKGREHGVEPLVETPKIKDICRMINGSCQKRWTTHSIAKAAESVSKCMGAVGSVLAAAAAESSSGIGGEDTEKRHLLKILSEVSPTLGRRTPEFTQFADARFLFAAVYAAGLSRFLRRNMTLREMHALAVIGLADTAICSNFCSHLESSSIGCRYGVDNNNIQLDSKKMYTCIEIFKYLSEWSQCTDKKIISRVLSPTTQEEAVVFAALLFRFDLSKEESRCAICEYYHLAASVYAEIGSFIPMTFESKYILKSAKGYDMRESLVSYCDLSLNLLTEAELIYIAVEKYGFYKDNACPAAPFALIGMESPASSICSSSDRTAFSSPAQALKHASTTLSVFVGIHPFSKNRMSPISMDDVINEVIEKGEESVLSFGIESKGEFVTYTISDLSESFKSMKAFVVAINDSVLYLSSRVVNHIKRLCEHQRNEEDVQYKNLLGVIKICERRSASLDRFSDDLERAIEGSKCPPDTRLKAIEVFRKLLDMGMFMRGWGVSDATRKGGNKEGKYPIKSEDTTYSEENRQAEIDLNVTQAIHAYEEALSGVDSSTVRQMIRSAPLLRTIISAFPNSQPQVRFAPTILSDQGYTIEDRIAIVKTGEEGSVFSCMRMSSNLIVSSAYYYLTIIFNIFPGFEISQMSEIF